MPSFVDENGKQKLSKSIDVEGCEIPDISFVKSNYLSFLPSNLIRRGGPVYFYLKYNAIQLEL